MHSKRFTRRYSTPATLKVNAIDALSYAVAKAAYTVRRLGTVGGVSTSPIQLDEQGFHSFEWDGITPYAILDCKRRVIAVLVGRPREGDNRPPEKRWEAAMARLGRALRSARMRYSRSFSAKQRIHRRGTFSVATVGVSYGSGQVRPMNLRQPAGVQEMLKGLLANGDLQRLAGFQSEALAAYFPKAYDHMCKTLDALYASQPELVRNFRNSEYPTATFNLGPKTVCKGHNDCTNYPGLACAITPFGTFDCDAGGHMILYDYRLRIRFPAWSTILLCSGGVRHGNTAIKPGEERLSFTQFCVGGNIRWVRHGFRQARKVPAAEREVLDAGQWEEQMARLSKFEDLEKDRTWLVEQEALRAAAKQL